MKANNLDPIARLSSSLLDLAYFGDPLSAPAMLHKNELFMQLFTEITNIGREKDMELALAKYYSSKTQLLQLQGRMLELIRDLGKRQSKLIAGIDADLTALLTVLEFLKKERIDKPFFKTT
ncbi:hypothetical protein [Pedobacter heparinus]|uniref:hypothetical protein n=1 Tax=Pedobacter heparinus TaxID=984 RepID=UPI00292E4D13|nr:hypothetical protein [Pedobacter heparinus]